MLMMCLVCVIVVDIVKITILNISFYLSLLGFFDNHYNLFFYQLCKYESKKIAISASYQDRILVQWLL